MIDDEEEVEDVIDDEDELDDEPLDDEVEPETF